MVLLTDRFFKWCLSLGKPDGGAVVVARVVFGLVLGSLACPALEFSSIFGDHMVLPMGRTVRVWGSADPGSRVVVEFSGVHRSASSNVDGVWQVNLPVMAASTERRVLRARSGEESIEISNLLVGEVWLCAGQSNMDFPLSRAVGGRDEAKRAGRYPGIRLMNCIGVHTSGRRYNEAERSRLNPERFFEGKWQVASEVSALPFSAVGWWAGKLIHQRKGVPVGLIDVSVGGSGAEAWLPQEVLEARDDYAELLGEGWLESEKISAWARGRAKLNLGGEGARHPFQPGFIFDAGVREWQDFPLTGVLWYQGETNAEIHDDAWNERLITDLVIGWRKILEQPELPFFMVQLPRIGGDDPLRRWWPQFREVQARAAGRLDGVELVVTEDLGWDSPDVHPPDKRPVGERLGKAVLQKQKE